MYSEAADRKQLLTTRHYKALKAKAVGCADVRAWLQLQHALYSSTYGTSFMHYASYPAVK